MLQLAHITFGYVPNQPVLENISLTMQEGEFIAIAGRNGSGKTTLTRLIMGLEKPSTGNIYYQGEDITERNAAERSQTIGYVFQRPDRQMFRNTVREEIAFGPQQLGYSPEEVEEITNAVMEKVGIAEYASAYPLHLRRGLKQRIAIASALAMRSKVLILDEPTSGQDGRETQALLQILRELHDEGITILLVTHDMDIIAAHCTRAIVMADGAVAFDGTPESLFTHCPALESWGLAKPLSVALSERIPGLGYCATMDDVQRQLLARAQKGETLCP